METKKIYVGSAQCGMKLASDVYDASSRLIVKAGTVLDDTIINKLNIYSVYSINVVVDAIKEEKVEYKNYYERLKETEEFKGFKAKFEESVDGLRSSLNAMVTKNVMVDEDKMLNDVKSVIEANKKGSSMLDMLNCMQGYDDLTYVHSMNVALISNVMAGWLGMSEEDTKILTLAGLLHDIGKVRIPVEIVSKPGKLTDEEYAIIKSHPQLGYDILKDMHIDERIKKAALMHHERCDGRGYPNKLKGDEIDDFAKIIAIADVYDAMTADRCYRKGMCPYTVIGHFESEKSVYDVRYLMAFLERIANTYVSNEALLSNGQQGKIILINKFKLSKPIVMVGNEIYDLSVMKDLEVERLL
ncbi:MAG: HD-GYP domain-containing protein [Lachnospiraceae bacterium]|nr:HD-GYP domain-containing protein [Lachnospiraceae bacterium]